MNAKHEIKLLLVNKCCNNFFCIISSSFSKFYKSKIIYITYKYNIINILMRQKLQHKIKTNVVVVVVCWF